MVRKIFCVEGTFLCAAAPTVPELGKSGSIPQPIRAGPVFPTSKTFQIFSGCSKGQSPGEEGW